MCDCVCKQTSLCRKQCPLNRESANYLYTFQKVFYESLTRISLGKIKSSASQSFPPFKVSVTWLENCIIIHVHFSRNLKSLKKWLAASAVNSRDKMLYNLLKKSVLNPQEHSGPSQASQMELFERIVDVFKLTLLFFLKKLQGYLQGLIKLLIYCNAGNCF